MVYFLRFVIWWSKFEIEQSCIYVLGVPIISFYYFYIDFGIVPTMWHFLKFQLITVPKNIIFLSKVNPDSTNVYADTNDMCDNNDQEMILSQPPREPDTMLNKDEYTTVSWMDIVTYFLRCTDVGWFSKKNENFVWHRGWNFKLDKLT